MTSKNRYRLIMVVSVLVVLLNAAVAYDALGRLLRAQQWLAHTLRVITATQEVSTTMTSVHNATLAYLITGSQADSARYFALTHQLGDQITALSTLTGDNQSQQQRVAFLRQRVQVRLSALETAMSTRRPGSDEAALPTVFPAMSESPDGGPTVRYVLGEMGKEEERLLADRTATARSARHRLEVTLAAATVLDLALLLIAFQLLVNASRDREELAARTAEITSLNTRLSGVNAELSTLNAELEQRVEQRTRELEVSNQELEAFSYSVSHDLRAPLRTIDGFSLALAEDFSDVLNAEGRDYIQRVRGGVQRMGTLIDALLQLSRVTRSEVQREQIDLSALATLVFGELTTGDSKPGMVFTAVPGIIAEADPRLMRVAFENLLGNAIKFTSKNPAPRIEFGQTGQGGETVYFVRDNGAGFDMQYVDRLFTAFQRLHGDRDFKGSGIGLATVSRIIRRHHGRIWAEGAIGQGATFFFTLK